MCNERINQLLKALKYFEKEMEKLIHYLVVTSLVYSAKNVLTNLYWQFF